jgi:hypothetical protein
MINQPTLTVKPGAVALMGLMAATRFHHFGTSFALPDATLAVFFLAGLLLGGRYLFAILLLEAGFIDYWAIAEMGVSDFCISSAYIFLIPTYAVMWLGGRWCGKQQVFSMHSLASRFVVLVISTSTAFLLSNGSFFLLSNNNSELSWAHYVDGFAAYFPAYLGATLVYVISIFAVASLVKSVLMHKASQQTI